MKKVLISFVTLAIFMFITLTDVHAENVQYFTLYYNKDAPHTTIPIQTISLTTYKRQIGINVTSLSSGARLTISSPSMDTAMTIVKPGEYFVNISSFVSSSVSIALQIKCDDNIITGTASGYFFI